MEAHLLRPCLAQAEAGQDPESADLDPDVELDEPDMIAATTVVHVWNQRTARLFRACCPALFRWLSTSGYEQAIIIKGPLHLFLWISCIISLFFSIIWFADVFTLKCVSTSSSFWDWRSYGLCLWEFVGLLIFFSSFTDSVRMIAHFDDDRQQVLAQKWDVLRRLNAESGAALRDAKQNVAGLSRKVATAIEYQLASYTANVFTFILPSLNHSAQEHQGSEDHVEAKLAALLRRNLVEIGELATASMEVLVRENPDVYKKLGARPKDRHTDLHSIANPAQDLLIWDRWLEVDFPNFGTTGVAHRLNISDYSFADRAWEVDNCGSTSMSGAAPMKLSQVSISRLIDLPQRQAFDKKQLSEAIAKEVLRPVKEILRLPDRFAKERNRIIEKTNDQNKRRRQRVGCGCPPEPKRTCCGFSLYVPNILACLCCYCRCMWCWGAAARKACRAIVAHQPPKQLSCGMCWIRLFTKLQERLLQGLFFSVIYLGVYSYSTYAALSHDPHFFINTACRSVETTQTSECSLIIARKFLGLVSMCCYIPALTVCLYHIERLDTVMETIQTINELKDVQQAVQAFSAQMGDVSDNVAVLQALNDRVLCRLDLVAKFDKAFARFGGNSAIERDIAQDLLRCSEQVLEALGPASEWFDLQEREQRERCEAATGHITLAVEKSSMRHASDAFLHRMCGVPGGANADRPSLGSQDCHSVVPGSGDSFRSDMSSRTWALDSPMTSLCLPDTQPGSSEPSRPVKVRVQPSRSVTQEPEGSQPQAKTRHEKRVPSALVQPSSVSPKSSAPNLEPPAEDPRRKKRTLMSANTFTFESSDSSCHSTDDETKARHRGPMVQTDTTQVKD